MSIQSKDLIPSKADAKTIISEHFKEPIRRKVFIEKCIENLNLPQDVMEDRSSGSTYNSIKSVFGDALKELIDSGVFVQEFGIVKYREKLDKKSTAENVSRDIKIDEAIRRLLADKSYTRRGLLVAVVNEVTDYTAEVVKADAGRLINEAEKNGAIVKDGDKYSLKVSETLPEAIETETENTVALEQQAALTSQPDKTAENTVKAGEKTVETPEPKVKNSDNAEQSADQPPQPKKAKKKTVKLNTDLLDNLSPEKFVDLTVQMLTAWYKSKGYNITRNKNIDGPSDGGIDGEIEGFDGMDYKHKIVIQVKHISGKNKHVKIVDVREFCGVAAADIDATQALFVTNRKFTVETTDKLVKKYKVKYFKLIDGELWIKLANACGFKLLI